MALTQEKRIEILEKVLEEYMGVINLSPVQTRVYLEKFSSKTKICFDDLCEIFFPIAEKILKKSFAKKN